VRFFIDGNGFAYNSSVTSTSLSLMLPMAFLLPVDVAIIFISIASICCLLFFGTNGIFATAIFLSIYLFYLTRKKLISIIPLLPFAIGLIVSKSFSSGSGRFEQWKDAIPYMMDNYNTIIGSGVGTFQFLYPVHQIINNVYERGFFTFLHSDIIQVFLETGIIGIVLIILTVKSILNRKSFFAFSVVAVYVANSIFNFPFRMSFDVLTLIFYLGLIYNGIDERIHKV
jgi:O-antigen ligase